MSMSRFVVAVVALGLAGAGPVAAAGPLDTYRQLTSVEPRCARPTSEREIVVCGNRRADRWRVPYIGYDSGDPRGEGVMAERERLAADPPLPCGVGAFLTSCGSVGIRVKTSFDGTRVRLRPIAP